MFSNRLKQIVQDFQRDISEGGTFWETFHRKFAHTLITHWYELHVLKPYWEKGYALNVGAGRDCGKLGDNVVSLDMRYGEDEYTKSHRWRPVYPDVIANAEDGLPFDDNTFDCVFSLHFLEHTNKTEFVIDEMIRVTKPEGFICGVIPCSIKNKPYNYWRDETHVKIWTRKDFLLWLSSRGFFDKLNLIQYCKMKRWINPWSFDFVFRKKRVFG